jgi:hypothetical protein
MRFFAIAKEPVPSSSEEVSALLDRLTGLKGVASRKAAATIILAKPSSARPVYISPVIISNLTSLLTPPKVVETIIWVGLQQYMHRVLCFYEVREIYMVSLKEESVTQAEEAEEISGMTVNVPAVEKTQFETHKRGFFGLLFRGFGIKKQNTTTT